MITSVCCFRCFFCILLYRYYSLDYLFSRGMSSVRSSFYSLLTILTDAFYAVRRVRSLQRVSVSVLVQYQYLCMYFIGSLMNGRIVESEGRSHYSSFEPFRDLTEWNSSEFPRKIDARLRIPFGVSTVVLEPLTPGASGFVDSRPSGTRTDFATPRIYCNGSFEIPLISSQYA